MASFASVPAKGLPPKPPDKGSFPLDHFRECSAAKETYMGCLKEHMMQAQTEACRELSAAYLQCRMDSCAATFEPDRYWLQSVPRCIPARRKLMAQQEMEKLGECMGEGAKV